MNGPTEVGVDGYTPLPHLTVGERRSIGGTLRKEVSRSALAEYEPAANRMNPVARLQEEEVGRQSELLPIRYGRMALSPFAFLRGAAAIMAADLSPSAVTGLKVQAIGDAHLSNFGVFASPERRLVFDVNDFDETLPAPWEWDVKRLVASVAVVARGNGANRTTESTAARGAAGAYREAMRSFAKQGTLEVWYAHVDVADWLDSQMSRRSHARDEQALQRIRTLTSAHAARKLVEIEDGTPRFKSLPPLITPLRELVAAEETDQVRSLVLRGFADYRESLAPERRLLLDRFRLVDLARKVVGVGSVGTRCLIALLVGRNEDDLLLLQFKEAGRSVLEPHAGQSPYLHHGQRVVEGQRMVQIASDVFLGWNTVADRNEHYYWRQLKDMKASTEVELLNAKGLQRYAGTCAWCLAHAHARSGDAIAIAAYLGAGTVFDRAMAAFASAYADQTVQDWKALTSAISSGAVEAVSGI